MVGPACFENHPLHPGDALPFFIAAGVIKEVGQLEQFFTIQDEGLRPTLFLGSYTMPSWAGNATKEHPTDFVYYRELGQAGNCRGLPGEGVAGLRKLKGPIAQLAGIGIKTVISVTNLPHERPIDVIPDLVEEALAVNPTGVEVNLSCPNGKKADGTFHAPTCNSPEASGGLMEEIRQRVGYTACVGVKDSAHVSSFEDTVDAAAVQNLLHAIRPYSNFITGINTIGNQPFPELDAGNGKGGMSGPVIAFIARQHLAVCRDAAPDMPYFSCGGIESSNAATEIPARLQDNGVLLVGGAQEFYRRDHVRVLQEWAQAYLFAG